jgi:hypothetical protein
MGEAAGIEILLDERNGRAVRRVLIRGRAAVFGRDRRNDVRLRSELVSRRHVRLRHQDGRWMVEDLASRNGTILNGRAIRLASVRPGDLVRLGPSGPSFRVLRVENSRLSADEGATRILRPARGRRSRSTAPAERARVPPRPTPAAPPRRLPGPRPAAASMSRATARSWWSPVGAVLGLAAGLLTGWAMWPATWFPYLEATAPALWLRLRVEALPSVSLTGLDPWPFRFLLTLHFGLLGYALQRPLRRVAWWLLLALAHGSAVWALRG